MQVLAESTLMLYEEKSPKSRFFRFCSEFLFVFKAFPTCDKIIKYMEYEKRTKYMLNRHVDCIASLYTICIDLY